ncbi:MAG: tRNA (adenosine(37)-N6)-dimethylallyltransferase MiaA [Bacilli bacterium]|nr:tRNA (adenosine(37)-N6)-dimethylallyltransferase MiaA [Bacilli bacterium]
MVIVIVGPTGVGKTKLSIELAKKLNGEVINADSTQVYKGMNIGTAKVTEEEKEGIKHYLLDIKNIDEDYTVYDYQKDARKCIKEIESNSKTPIMVGGTGLYIKASLYNYEFEDEDNINYVDETLSNEELYDMLLKIDRNTTIHKNNRKRIIRALNYYYANGHIMENNSDKLLYDALFIGLTTDRDTLYDRINKRVDIMVTNGLIDEAKRIYDSKIRSKAVMTPICYKELFPYFEGNKTIEECLDDIKKGSRRYAKRQYTWNKHQFDVKWFDVDFNNFDNTVNDVLEYIENVKN